MYRENENDDVFEERDALRRENDALKKKVEVLSIVALLICAAYGASTWQLHLQTQSPFWHFSAFMRFAFTGWAALYLWVHSSLFFQGMKSPHAICRQSCARVILMMIGVFDGLVALGNLFETFAKLF